MLIVHDALAFYEGILERCVDQKIPAPSRRKLGKTEFLRLPVHVNGDVEEVRLVGRTHVILTQADPDGVTKMPKIRLPGLFPVQGQIRIAAAEIISTLKGLYAGENRMGALKGDDLLHKTADLIAGHPVVPAGPAQLVVLAVGIVVAHLCIVGLIAGV